ncbi:UPF0481 protein At3g47200-like [Neltuma alba]|uniref:UPF0481 protein At3g47200-like n=1 Tax=Neltuma alba TaxID=207710 RepID=UPI0010A2AE39|nr:UPF0481 protein At3g47200-like [Prosopis alba]
MDASFIVELSIMYYGNDELLKNGKLSQPWLQDSIRFDLLLLENQLPFFVIEELFNKAFPHDRCGIPPSILRLTYDYFWCFNLKQLEPNSDVKIKHFTDLIRLFRMQGQMSQGQHPFSEVASHILLYNANKLQEAGIKLKASDSKGLLDLRFSGHAPEIPKIRVDVYTELFWGNIIALEQCHYSDNAYIADYALLFKWLIDTDKDVDLLVHSVENHLGDTNNVALLFNGLSEHAVHSTFSSEYLDICQRLNGYCQNPFHKMKATLRRDYCGTPWQTVASIAAVVLLFLTIVQTIFSILQE